MQAARERVMTKFRIKDVLQFPTVKNQRIGRVMEKICRFEHSQSKRMERADSYVSAVVLVVSRSTHEFIFVYWLGL